MQKKLTASVSVPEELWKWFQEYSRQKGVSASAYLTLMISNLRDGKQGQP